jgi:hypothetical protein
VEYQKLIFDWAAAQPAATGAAIFAAGLLYGFCGFRMIRPLLVVPAAAAAAWLGDLLTVFVDVSPPMATGLGAVVGGAAAVLAPHVTVVVISGFTWAVLGGYLSWQFGLSDTTCLVVVGVAGLAGTVLTMLSRQAMTVLLTTLQGAVLMLLGFVATSSAAMPALGSTFRNLACEQSVVVPVLLAMLTVTAFSYQATARQGDICTGMSRPVH